MEQRPHGDVWDTGDFYEPYVGRWSRRVASEFLNWLSVPERKDWLDVGCGSGALTRTILEKANPNSVIGLDSSPDYIEGKGFDRSRSPRQDFDVLFRFRDDHVHDKVAAYRADRSTKRYNNRFPDPVAGVLELRHAIFAATTDRGDGPPRS